MRRLAIVRPEPGASSSVERAAAMGMDAFAMPLFAVEPVAWQAPGRDQFDALLLTSANSVRHGGDGLKALRDLPVYAVGEASAAAASEAGFEVAGSGTSGVERLLDSISPDTHLLHLCGEHRTATHSKQPITTVAVYRSTELAMPDGFASIEGQTVAIHSPRAGRRLAELVDQANLDRATVRIAAISDAAASATGTGWEMCVAAETPSEAALLALAARLCDNPVTT